jgi:hypothetical protein
MTFFQSLHILNRPIITILSRRTIVFLVEIEAFNRCKPVGIFEDDMSESTFDGIINGIVELKSLKVGQYKRACALALIQGLKKGRTEKNKNKNVNTLYSIFYFPGFTPGEQRITSCLTIDELSSVVKSINKNLTVDKLFAYLSLEDNSFPNL